MKVKIAVYRDSNKYYACNTENDFLHHLFRKARIAEVEINFEDLPDPTAVFGKGIVINKINAEQDSH